MVGWESEEGIEAGAGISVVIILYHNATTKGFKSLLCLSVELVKGHYSSRKWKEELYRMESHMKGLSLKQFIIFIFGVRLKKQLVSSTRTNLLTVFLLIRLHCVTKLAWCNFTNFPAGSRQTFTVTFALLEPMCDTLNEN